MQSHNQQQQQQSLNQHQQHQNSRRNLSNHIITSKQNHLSQQQQPQQLQQAQPQLQQPQQLQEPQQHPQQKQQQKVQPKITLLTHNNNQQKLLKNLTTPQVSNSPPLTVPVIANISNTTPTTPKSPLSLSNATTKIVNIQPNLPVTTISSQQNISNTVQTSVVENCNFSEIVSPNLMASVAEVIEKPKQILKRKEKKYTCGQILQSGIENFTNSKEKTPMCLVNELARYNKITHQYRLTGEQGPAHSKRFTVTLKLGNEEYTADGPSIKKTQHTAASEAITKTKHEHPPPKTVRQKLGKIRSGISATITPTVELNALAMKLGEPTIYAFDPASSVNSNIQSNVNGGNGLPLPPQQPISNNYSQQHTQGQGPNIFPENGQYQLLNHHRNNIYLNGIHPRFSSQRGGRGGFGHRGSFLKYNPNSFNGMLSVYAKDACKITLMVGKKKFVGTGPTIQSAKHDAAAKALEILKPLDEEPENYDNNVIANVEDQILDIKSPISLVHEMALKRNLNVIFEVKSETGPPHMKTFITICTVGTTITEGIGNGKKISKKRAAEKMLEELRKLPPIIDDTNADGTSNEAGHSNCGRVGKIKNSKRTTDIQPQGQTPLPGRKKSKNLIKENSEIDDGFNPISKLTEIQHALKEREAIYTVIDEKGAPRRREFIVEVTAGNMSTRGMGYSKKLARRNAAKNLLTLMGYETISNSNKENDSNIVNTDEKNTESEKPTQSRNEIVCSSLNNNSNISSPPTISQSGNTSRQIVPGIIHLPQNKINSPGNEQIKQTNKNLIQQQEHQSLSDNSKESQNNKVVNESVLPSKGVSSIIEQPVSSSSDFAVRPKDQLLYLAKLLGFQAIFSDYPKGNHGEYLTIVTLSTDPPQICHGAGADTEASQDIAARTALQMLSKLGLDNVIPKEKTSSSTSQKSSKVLAAADSSKN